MFINLRNSRWEDTAHEGAADRKKTNGADMVFQKKYIGYLWVSLRIEISLLNYISTFFFWGSGTSFAKMLQSRNPKESYDPWFAEVYF